MSSCLLCSCHNLQGSWGLQAASFAVVTAMAGEIASLTVLEAKCPEPRCLQDCVLEEKGPFLPLLLPKAPDSPWLERHPEVSPWSSPAVSSLRVSLGPKRPLFYENISHMGLGCSLMTLPQPDHVWQ